VYVLLRVKADMHIHSTYSDGKAGPREILLTASYRDLAVISITDHNTFQGSVAAKRIAENIPDAPLVIIGNEVRTDHGDILVYCFEPVNIPYKLDLLIDYAHENNCLVVPANPFDLLRLGIGDLVFEYKGWDALEVWNASANPRANRRALEAAKLLGLPGLANSDAHILDYIGVAYTVLEIDDLSVEAVFKAIKNGRVHPHKGYPSFKAFFKKMLWGVTRRVMGGKRSFLD
jgi:predicted metal-dependent phosphoesterase TrpH